ncbi:hypothetical protein BJF93_20775 [Xaviernesmea oryzae]|uniref:Uncharacterized protein n=1 Tax=Xaviernesmea oryzae TaxID=464029 RepID=A0A1Q9AZR5_9HYPH|nr:hypothetical protein [Xaviernesmea oryzae]OLP61228.1 hypothetical protein BJF93_20775 [Xaviernesmea oryzae]SEL51121.1 hypothetical protein SAMN04487976_10932 [Xaviernesmea oryzae]
MAGNKTHEQHQRILNKQEVTTNGAPDFPVQADLEASDAAKAARQAGETLKAPQTDLTDPDDRNILRGAQQESRT